MNDSRPLGVSEFLSRINELLETQVACVEGEVADVRVSQGKWLHFDLKDDAALVHCFALAFRIRTPLEDGMKVRVWGVPRVYPRSGRFSLMVERVELTGEGALRRAFQRLQATLAAEGLFDPSRKRALPRFPQRIALLTSPEAAAYQDFLTVLGERFGGLDIDFIPVPVQGRGASEIIAQALDWVNEQRPLWDVLVLVRGGGSLEDLQTFNDELVVRALARSRVPTLLGIGHERDVTLADLAADVRASTPSNAAELLVPSRDAVARTCRELEKRLMTAAREQLRARERDLVRQTFALQDALRETQKQVELVLRRMETVGERVRGYVRHRAEALERTAALLRDRIQAVVTMHALRVGSLERLLRELHPRRVLARGYSVTRRADGSVLRDARAAHAGDPLSTQLARGTLESEITVVHDQGDHQLFASVRGTREDRRRI